MLSYPEILEIPMPATTVAPIHQSEDVLGRELVNYHFTAAVIILCLTNIGIKGFCVTLRWYVNTVDFHSTTKCSARCGFDALKLAATTGILIFTTLYTEEGTKNTTDLIPCSFMAFFSIFIYPTLHFIHVFLLAQCMSGRFLRGKVERVCGLKSCVVVLSCICSGAAFIAFVSTRLHLATLGGEGGGGGGGGGGVVHNYNINIVVGMFILTTTYLTTALCAYRLSEGKIDAEGSIKKHGILMAVPKTQLASFAMFSVVFILHFLYSPGEGGKKMRVQHLLFLMWSCVDFLLIDVQVQCSDMARCDQHEENQGVMKTVIWNTNYAKV